MDKKTLLEVAHVSAKGGSMRITIPKKIGKLLDLKDTDMVGFYEYAGMIVIGRLK